MGAGRNGGGEKLAFLTGGPDKESRPEELSGQAGGQCRRPVRACRKGLPWTPIPRPSWAQYVGSRITSGMEHPISINEKDLGTQVGLLLLQPPHCVHQEGPLSEGQEAWHVGGRQANHAAVLVQHLSPGGQVTGWGTARAAGLPARRTLHPPVLLTASSAPSSASPIWEGGTRKDEAIALRMRPGSHLACARLPLGCRLLSQSCGGLCGAQKQRSASTVFSGMGTRTALSYVGRGLGRKRPGLQRGCRKGSSGSMQTGLT